MIEASASGVGVAAAVEELAVDLEEEEEEDASREMEKTTGLAEEGRVRVNALTAALGVAIPRFAL